MAEEIHRPHTIPSIQPMHPCIAGSPFPSHPWALRPTALKVRRSRRPPFRVREGRGPAGAGLPESINGEIIKAVPEPTCPPPIADDDNGGAIVFMPWTAVPRYRERIHPVPIGQPALRVGSWECGETVSQSSQSVVCVPAATAADDKTHVRFPHYHFLAMAVGAKHSSPQG